jgi:predicted metal-dependent phosphoesterase TrpH
VLIRADLHVHTTFSSDASLRPKTVVEQLCAHPYIKAAAVTDHNTVEGCSKARKLADDYGDILVIPGVEMNLVEGELILLGVEELPPKPWNLKNAIAYAKKMNAVSVAPHPFRGYGLREYARNPEIDAIETLNGVSPAATNRLAKKLAKEMGCAAVGGSDAHEAKELWSAHTEIQSSLEVEGVLDAIRKRAVKPALSWKSIRF